MIRNIFFAYDTIFLITYISIGMVFLNSILDWVFLNSLGHVGIAFSTSIVSFATFLLYGYLLYIKFNIGLQKEIIYTLKLLSFYTISTLIPYLVTPAYLKRYIIGGILLIFFIIFNKSLLKAIFLKILAFLSDKNEHE